MPVETPPPLIKKRRGKRRFNEKGSTDVENIVTT
jgi:hypothetical protein